MRRGWSGWLVVLLLCAVLGLHNGSRISPSSLVDELRLRFGVDYGGVGDLIGAYTLTYAFSQLVAGFLTDRFGARRLLLLGLVVMTLGSSLFAFTTDYTVALVGRWTMGIAGGLLYTPAITYCLGAFDRSARGQAMAFAQSGTGAGLVLSVAALPVLEQAVGLTGAFAAYPLVSVVLLLAVLWRLPAIPADSRGAFHGLGDLARARDFWLLVVGYAAVGLFASSAVQTWLPGYLRDAHGWTAVQAGFAGGLVSAGLLVLPAPFGAMTDRLSTRKPVMLLGCGLAVAGLAVMLAATNPFVAIGGALLVSASMAALLPMQAVYATERFAAVGAGTAVGLVNTGGQIAQAMAGPAYGRLVDQGLGWGAVWLAALLLALVRTGAVVLLSEPERSVAHEPVLTPVPASVASEEAAPV